MQMAGIKVKAVWVKESPELEKKPIEWEVERLQELPLK